ncbi:CDGSH iron-sulfur domain-containing protein [Streptomyces sp. ME109]|uniref:CDGSH iron-sulfur domain-containing protein n=1 Tax=Streptomyces sp. me109 TaxID=1827853 RepID=UPI0021C8A5FF|nr:CDGSH iron-sulfur domain-containing protein [Streptomyces sp. me109]
MPKHSDTAPGGIPTCKARRVRVEPQGPVLVEGPVDIVLDDGTVAHSDRFMVAICTCRRSRTYPWCDTSHRPRAKAADTPPSQGCESTRDGDGTSACRAPSPVKDSP